MLLELFREFGCEGLNPYSPYDMEADDGNDCDEELDVVDVAGCAKRNFLRTAAVTSKNNLFILATAILAVPGAFATHVLTPEASVAYGSGKPCNDSMLRYIPLLVAWGILSPVRRAFRLFCPLFTVSKANKSARLIFDGRPLNKLCRKPPELNLPQVQEILKRRPKMILSGDLRHYFHQLSLEDGSKIFLGVKCGGQVFAYNTLPMGLSWSPWLAQTISFLLLTHCEKGAKKLFADMPNEKLPSSLAILRDGIVVGHAHIVYDNFILTFDVDDMHFAQEVARRLVGNAKNFGIAWKELKLHGACASRVYVETVELQAQDATPTRIERQSSLESPKKKSVTNEFPGGVIRGYTHVTILGVEVDLSDTSLPEITSRIGGARWRHSEKRIEKMKLLDPAGPLTRADVARIVGYCVWDMMISLKRLGEVADIIDQLRDTAREIHSKRDWKKPISKPVSDKWINIVLEWQREAIKNRWRRDKPPVSRRSIFWLASDAATCGMGGVWLDENSPVVIDSWSKEGEWADTHIFLKEVRAAIRTIRWFVKHYGADGPMEIRLAIDSIPAARALTKGYSSNRSAAKMITRFWKWADARELAVTCVDIDTSLNVADCLTRPKKAKRPRTEEKKKDTHNHEDGDFCDSRVVATWNVLKGVLAGRHLADVEKQTPWTPAKSLDVGDDDSDFEEDGDEEEEPGDGWSDIIAAHSTLLDD